MSDSALILTCFLVVVLGITAAGMVLRDLFRTEPKPRLGFRGAVESVPPPGRRSLSDSLTHWLQQMVLEARLPFNTLSLALLLVLAAALPAIAMYVWNEDIIATLAGSLVGLGLTVGFLEYYRRRRVNEVLQQLPSVIDQLARAVRAGESLDQALVTVSERLKPPLGPELRTMCRQISMGLSIPAALQSFYERVPLVDVQILVSTLSVYREVGGNLASTLERMAALLRDRLNFRQQVRSQTAAGRFAAAFLALVTPVVFLYFYFFRPEKFFPVLTDQIGVTLLMAVAVLEIVGLLWVWSIVRLKF